MLNLLASAPEDGWGFVRRGKEILLVRPPYKQSNASVVVESTVEKAIHAHGFVAMSKSFPDWSSLVKFLEEQLVEARKARGDTVPGPEAARKLVRRATRHILENYLDRIQSELLPNREWNAALELLTILIGLETVKNDPVLFGRTHDLLERCMREKIQAESGRQELIDEEKGFEQQFPNVAHRYKSSEINKLSREVYKRHQLMPVGTT